MLKKLYILRTSRYCWTFTSSTDLFPPNNRGWFLYSVNPKSGGLLNTGDFVSITPITNKTAYVAVLRGNSVIVSGEVSGGSPTGTKDFYWLAGKDSISGNHLVVYRDIDTIRSNGNRAAMHIELFDPNGSHLDELPWNKDNISYPSLELRWLSVDKATDEGIPGETEQDDEGSGEEP